MHLDEGLLSSAIMVGDRGLTYLGMISSTPIQRQSIEHLAGGRCRGVLAVVPLSEPRGQGVCGGAHGG
jgi:hypothetical protein